MKYISLIRSVNVGGRNKVKMAEFRECLAKAPGLSNIQTYIQSGNVVLESDKSASEVSAAISKIIKDHFGFEAEVITKTLEELKDLFAGYSIKGIDQKQQYFTFLLNAPDEQGKQKLADRDFGNDKYDIKNDIVYIGYAISASETKLTNNVIENKLGVAATTRNRNSVKKLIELSS